MAGLNETVIFNCNNNCDLRKCYFETLIFDQKLISQPVVVNRFRIGDFKEIYSMVSQSKHIKINPIITGPPLIDSTVKNRSQPPILNRCTIADKFSKIKCSLPDSKWMSFPKI